MVRVVIEVPDASHLQLLADGLAEAANMRTRAAGVAARQVLEDPSITDKRSDATKLLQVVADADWIRTVAEQLPMLVLADEAPPAPPAPAADPYAAALQDLAAPTAGGLPVAPPPAPPSLAPTFRPARGHDFDLPDDAAARLRALTVPPGARLHPRDPIVEAPDPPVAAAQAQAHLEALAGGEGADVFFDGS